VVRAYTRPHMSPTGTLISPLLIGRDEVVELASRRIHEAASGRGQFLLVTGEAGIGKTRLLGAIRAMAGDAGFRVAGGAVAPHDRDVSAAMLLDLGRALRRRPEFDDLGDRLLAVVEAIVNAERPGRRALIQQTVDLILAEATRPTLLVFEDLQWADEASLQVIAELARRGTELPLLLGAAYRSDEVSAGSALREWRSRLVTQRLAEEARLERLTVEQTGLLTTMILGRSLPAPRAVVQAVHERTDGVPLHVEELLAAVGGEGLVDSRTVRDAAVPDTLEDATLQRVRRLSPEAQAVARAGAVIGRSFAPDVVARVMDLPVDGIDGPLDELVEHQVLDREGSGELVDFRHQLLRDALYGTVPAGELRRLHARAAELGAGSDAASAIHASLHFERAGMRDEAHREALLGARRAARLSAHRESTELYARALANLPAATAAETEADLLADYAAEALLLEESELCVDLARRARERFLAAGDRVGAANALTVVTTMWRWDGHALHERVETLQQVIDELEAEPSSERRDAVRLNAYTQLAWASMDDLDLGAARESTTVAVEIAERLEAPSAECDPELWLATLDVLDGRITAGLDRLTALASSSHRRATETRLIADEELAVSAYREVGVYAMHAMEYERGAAELVKGRAFANRVEMTHCGRVMASTDAFVAWALGRWSTAEQIARQALADRSRGRTGAIARWALGYVALGRGDHAAARAALVAARQFGDAAHWPEMTLPAMWGLAENALLSGDIDSAIATTDEAAAVANRGEGVEAELVPFVVTGVRARLAAGRPEEAAAWLDLVEASVRTRPDVAAPAIEHATGLLRLAAGSLNPAIAALVRAAEMWSSKGRIWEASWARLDLAAGLLRANRYVDAATHLVAVRTTARELASRPLHDRIAELEDVARGRGSERARWHPLTQREYEIARNVAAGLTNPEIAKELFLSPKTVSAHVEHILAKLGVARRAEIAAWVTTLRPADRVGARTEAEPVATTG